MHQDPKGKTKIGTFLLPYCSGMDKSLILYLCIYRYAWWRFITYWHSERPELCFLLPWSQLSSSRVYDLSAQQPAQLRTRPVRTDFRFFLSPIREDQISPEIKKYKYYTHPSCSSTRQKADETPSHSCYEKINIRFSCCVLVLVRSLETDPNNRKYFPVVLSSSGSLIHDE